MHSGWNGQSWLALFPGLMPQVGAERQAGRRHADRATSWTGRAYTCFLMSRDSRVLDVRQIGCTSDAGAVESACASLVSSGLSVVEVWDGVRFICRVEDLRRV